MKYYLAPLEGITTYIYRNTYHRIFPPMDKYFTPFLVPRQKKGFSSRELNDILPAHNQGLFVVPQLLTNRAEDFIYAARMLMDYGYGEVNLNLGCPSGTVVPKGKGAGFLAHPVELERFLDGVFSKLTVRISVKARIGMESPEEFGVLFGIFQKFPLEELIIHPRVREDYYKNQPNLAVFGKALRESKSPVCYNGDIFSHRDCEALLGEFPSLKALMLGRGIIANPSLREECAGISLPCKSSGQGQLSWQDGSWQEGQGLSPQKLQAGKLQKFQQFHDALYQGYQEALSGDRNVLFKMKEIWTYMIQSFTDYKPYAKQIKKAETLQAYGTAVRRLFQEQEVTNHGRFSF